MCYRKYILGIDITFITCINYITFTYTNKKYCESVCLNKFGATQQVLNSTLLLVCDRLTIGLQVIY